MTAMDSLAERLTDVFREVFDDPNVELRDETVAADIEDWDSLNHVKLVVAIEERFGIKFSNREIGSWKNVGDIRRSLASKLGA
jgi:acyl carrier protein